MKSTLAFAICLIVVAPTYAQLAQDNLTFLGSSTVNFAHEMDAEVVGNKVYTSVGAYQGLETYDVSDPQNPTRESYNPPQTWRSKHYGDLLFAFNRDAGLRIYDISGATTLLGWMNSPGTDVFFEGGALSGTTLFVAAHQAGIVAVDISDLQNPTVTTTYTLNQNACWNVEALGNYLYIANGRFGLSIADVSDSLVEIASLDLPGLANDVVLDGSVAVLSLGPSGIATVDISDPTDPLLLDVALTKGNAWGMGIENHQVIVGSWRYLELYDVTDPANISMSGWDNTHTWAMGADINNGLIGVADWRGMATYQVGVEPVPDIDVNPLVIDFGEVLSSEDTLVKVFNTGGATLNVNSISTPSGITVSTSTFSLAPGDSQEVLITASGISIYGSLNYLSDDPDEASFIQYVYANNTDFPQVGSIAPDFTLQGTDGNWYTLSDLRGNVIFLEFGGGW